MASEEFPCESLLDAIHNKYGESQEASCEIFISLNAPGGTTDSGKLVVPQHLNVNAFGVSIAGSPEELRALCGNVRELDLTNNKLSEWHEIFKMLECMPRLMSLNLTSNNLNPSSLMEDDLKNAFPNVKLLVMNNTGVSWDTVAKLLKMFPCIMELHLSLNDLGQISSCDIINYQSLSVLHMNQHKFTHISELLKLGNCFPCLETLVTTETDLRSLEEDSLGAAFPRLQCLNISKCALEGWLDIDAIRSLPSLCDLRIQNIPFLEVYEEKLRRQLLIAHLPNVTRLNGSRVSDTEREDAERAHIRHYMDMDLCMRPLRYDELEEKYGKLDPLADVNFEPKITYKVKVAVDGTDRTEEIEISTKQSVDDFKKFLKPFCRLKSRFKLYLYGNINGDEKSLKEDLNFCNNRMLYNCKLEDGDLFLIVPPLSENLEQNCE